MDGDRGSLTIADEGNLRLVRVSLSDLTGGRVYVLVRDGEVIEAFANIDTALNGFESEVRDG